MLLLVHTLHRVHLIRDDYRQDSVLDGHEGRPRTVDTPVLVDRDRSYWQDLEMLSFSRLNEL